MTLTDKIKSFFGEQLSMAKYIQSKMLPDLMQNYEKAKEKKKAIQEQNKSFTQEEPKEKGGESNGTNNTKERS